MSLQRISLGNHANENYNLNISCQGLGVMNIVTEAQQEVIHKAIGMGVNFFDTAEMYGAGKSEEALGQAIQRYKREELVIATKAGCTFEQDGLHICGSKPYIFQACDKSLRRLNVSYIDLYYLHRVDPNTPFKESILALKELVEQGKIKTIGLSEVSKEQIEIAHAIHPITAVQIEYSPWSRQDEKNQVIETCHRLGIGIVAYSPLGRAFFVEENKETFFNGLENDFRNFLPRYKGEDLTNNLQARNLIESIAKAKEIKTQTLVLAWTQSKGIIPIPGTTKVPHLIENVSACHLNLSKEDVDGIDQGIDQTEFHGLRYPSKELSGIYPENID